MLKKLLTNKGHSLIETLTSFAILGIFATLIITLFVKFIFNPLPKLIKKAQIIGKNEIKYCMANYIITDSSYFSTDSLVFIKRNIKTLKDNFYKVTVSVIHKKNSDTLVSYKTMYNYFE